MWYVILEYAAYEVATKNLQVQTVESHLSAIKVYHDRCGVLSGGRFAALHSERLHAVGFRRGITVENEEAGAVVRVVRGEHLAQT